MHETYYTPEHLAQRGRDPTERTIAGIAGMFKEEGPEEASRGTFDADLLKYVTRGQSAD